MAKVLAWLQYLRTIVLAFRVIAFEKTDEAALVAWGALTILVAAVTFTYTAAAGGAALLGMGVLWFGIRGWARRNRCRLVRTADRVEFADIDTAADAYRQGFTVGVVLRRMETEDVKRTGEYDEALMAESRWFFVVSAPGKTRIVPCERIVGIEIDMEGDNVWDH
ncbi:hypothetical protein [Sulfurimonas diazotrophicus]|uniref:Uncharacterized protein n=1 Tax=Sulfurimonas diazotrophicus TaxID=3131939 RepID=A0ABZ3HBA2_9BACT